MQRTYHWPTWYFGVDGPYLLRTAMSIVSLPSILFPGLKTPAGDLWRTKGTGVTRCHQSLTGPSATATATTPVCPATSLTGMNIPKVFIGSSFFIFISWSQVKIESFTGKCRQFNIYKYWITCVNGNVLRASYINQDVLKSFQSSQ